MLRNYIPVEPPKSVNSFQLSLRSDLLWKPNPSICSFEFDISPPLSFSNHHWQVACRSLRLPNSIINFYPKDVYMLVLEHSTIQKVEFPKERILSAKEAAFFLNNGLEAKGFKKSIEFRISGGSSKSVIQVTLTPHILPFGIMLSDSLADVLGFSRDQSLLVFQQGARTFKAQRLFDPYHDYKTLYLTCENIERPLTLQQQRMPLPPHEEEEQEKHPPTNILLEIPTTANYYLDEQNFLGPLTSAAHTEYLQIDIPKKGLQFKNISTQQIYRMKLSIVSLWDQPVELFDTTLPIHIGLEFRRALFDLL